MCCAINKNCAGLSLEKGFKVQLVIISFSILLTSGADLTGHKYFGEVEQELMRAERFNEGGKI